MVFRLDWKVHQLHKLTELGLTSLILIPPSLAMLFGRVGSETLLPPLYNGNNDIYQLKCRPTHRQGQNANHTEGFMPAWLTDKYNF